MVAKPTCRTCSCSCAAHDAQMASSSPPSSGRAPKTPQTSSSSSSTSTSDEDIQRWVRSTNKATQSLARTRPSIAQLPAGATGLENLGNTCYMNSVLQVLSYTEGFAHYMISGFYKEDLNSQSATRGEIADEVARLLVVLWSQSFRFVSPYVLRGVIGAHRRDFGGSRMHDAHEFFLLLLEWLHDDLNVAAPSPKPSPLPAGLEDVEGAERSWRQFRKMNDSIISRLFYGQQKSVLLCTACGHESATFEIFTLLSLPLAAESVTSSQLSLYHCLQQYIHGDLISGWTCSNCRRKHDVFKKFDIWRMPPVVIMHLKRFTYSGSTLRKAHAYVSFPLRDLDLSQLAIGPRQASGSSLVYNLYAVVEHHGSSQSGHYTAFCWNQPAARWFFYDDTSVKEVDAARVKEASAYMLCYAARDVA